MQTINYKQNCAPHWGHAQGKQRVALQRSSKSNEFRGNLNGHLPSKKLSLLKAAVQPKLRVGPRWIWAMQKFDNRIILIHVEISERSRRAR
jgi:hypothetical protein